MSLPTPTTSADPLSGAADGGIQLTTLPSPLTMKASPALGPATVPANASVPPASLDAAAVPPPVPDVPDKKDADLEDEDDDEEDGKKPASKAVTPKTPAASTLTAAEKASVHKVLDPNDADPAFAAVMAGWSDAQVSYYLDLATAQTTAVLNAKAARFIAGDVEAEPPVTLTWRNVGYTKAGEKEPRLHGLTGALRPQQTVCVLGGPDAGITSFLMVLAGRNQGGVVTGEILLNGARPDASIRRRVGLVPKDDLHLAILNTQETLEFSARLRLPNVVPDRVKRIRAQTVMKLLGLRHAAQTLVGSDTIRGVSGGEKRRLSIGVEWVAGHQALLCDLPTNGLDSASAFDLVATYKYIAQASNRSLMCSLVQPSPELLDLFDTVMVMSHGHCVYYGPRVSVMHYFFSIGYQMPAPGVAAGGGAAKGAAGSGDDDGDDDSDAAKSEPDYIEELSVQPHHFYQGQGVTDEKGQIVVRAYTAKPNPYSKTAGTSAANVIANASLIHNHFPASAAAPAATVATLSDLDDLAAADGSLPAGGAGAVRVYVPRKSVVDGAPIPALSGGLQVTANGERHSPSNVSPNGHGLESKHGVPASTSAITVTVAARPDFGGSDPNAPKALEATIVSTKAQQRVKISHFEGVQHLIRSWTESEYHRALGQTITQAVSGSSAAKPNPETATDAYNTNFPYQLYLAMQRQWLLVVRDTATSVGAIMQAIIIALLVGSLFWQIGTSQKDMRTRFGLFFFVLMFQIMDSLSSIPSLMDQRLNYYAQSGAGWYRGPAFYFAYVVARIPLTMLSIFTFFIIEYPMSGLTGGVGSGEFGYLLLLVFLTAQCGKAWCLFIGAISPTQPVAMALTPVTMILFTMFCGFMVPRDSIPNGWIWVYYISFFTWSVRGAAQNELVPLTFSCNPEEYLQISPFARPVCPIPDGVAALAQYDMEPGTNDDGTPDTNEKWIMMRNLMFFFIAYNVIACLALLRWHWFHNDNSTVATLSDVEDEDAADRVPTKEVDASGNTTAVAGAGAAKKSSTPRSRKGKGTPRSRSGAAKRAAAAGHHVINVQAAATVSPAQEDVAAAGGKSHDMKVEPMTLSFSNLTYKIDLPRAKKGHAKQRELLIRTFGFAKPGTLVALMGPSGAGKTTLLDVLANKKNGGYTRGSLLINGKARDRNFQLISGYVEQFDSHNPFSTVREAIEFSARLRLPADMAEADKMERVEAVLDRLSLRPHAARQIGTVESGGVSPEIRKKVTIGVELVMNPSILFLDEPTTGLDSMAAMAVMEAVRKLAATISVVCTVHQPSAEIVAQFDTMLLMQKGGRVAYHGPISALSEYLGSVGLGRCPDGRNIADHALEVAGGGISVKTAAPGTAGAGKDPATLFAESPQYAAIQRELASLGHNVQATDEQTPNIPLGDGVERGLCELDTTSTFWTQYKELAMRFIVSVYRDGPTFKGRMGNAVIIAFILSTLYFQLGKSQADAANRVSLFYLTALFPCFSAGEIIPKIVAARPIYFRERQAKMYSPFAYFLGRFTGQLPYIFLEGTIYCVVMYFVANLTLADAGMHFWIFYFTYMVMRMSGFAFAEFGASAVEKAEAGAGVQSVMLTLFMLFAGFLVPRTGIPRGWIWMHYLSIFKYPISLLANNELRDLTFECADNKGAIGPLELFNRSATTDALTMSCTIPTDAYSNANCFGYICPYTSGEQMLRSFDMDGDNIGGFYGIICLMVVAYQAISYLVLKNVQHIKR